MSKHNSLFDAKEYKHVSSDKDKTTLKHRRGHTITVAHNAISPKMRSALQALGKLSNSQTDGQKQEEQDKNQYGKVIRKAEGGKIDPRFAAITEKQQRLAKELHPEPSHEEKIKQSQRHKTQDQFMRNTAGKSVKHEYAGGGNVAEADYDKALDVKAAVTGQPKAPPQQQPTGERPMATRPTYRSSRGDEAWPSPSQTSVGQAAAAKRGYADGGEVSEPSPEELGGLPEWFHTAGEQTHQSQPGGSTGGGADTYAYDAGLPCLNPHCKSQGKPHPNCKCYTGGEGYAEGGEVSKLRYCAHGKEHESSCSYAKGGGVSEQGRDVRHGNRATKPNERAQSQHFAREEAKGRAQHERTVKPKMKGLASGGRPEEARPIPGGGYMPTPVDESQMENELSQYEAQGQPQQSQFVPQYTNQANPDDMPAQEMSPTLQPGMPGYDEPHTPIDDTEDPPMDGNQRPQFGKMKQPGQIEQGNDHYSATNQQQAPDDFEQELNAQQPVDELSQPPVQANMTGQPQQPMQPQQDPKAQIAAHMLNENKKWEQDIVNGHITPKTYNDLMYYNRDGSEKSTLGKIGSIFGIMLSGFGAGLAHQENMAIKMMDQTIKNDLDAQIKSKDNAVNYVKLEQARLLNNANVISVLQSADKTDAEKQQVLEAVSRLAIGNAYLKTASGAVAHVMKKVSDYPEGSPERAKAAQLAMMVAKLSETNSAQAAAMAAAGVESMGNYGMNLPASGGKLTPEQEFQNEMLMLERNGEGELAGKRRAKHRRGVPGEATQEVPSDVTNQLDKMDILDDKVKDLLDFAQKNRGTINPQTINLAQQKAEELTSFYNDSVGSLQMTEGRLKWLGEQIKKNPTSLIQHILGNQKVLGEIRDSNAHRRDIKLNKLGFDVHPKTPGSAKSQIPEGTEGMHGSGKTAFPVIFKNGKWVKK